LPTGGISESSTTRAMKWIKGLLALSPGQCRAHSPAFEGMDASIQRQLTLGFLGLVTFEAGVFEDG